MFNILNSKRVSLLIFIISFFFPFVKLEITFSEKNISNETHQEIFIENKYFYIDYKYKNQTDFIKIQILGNDDQNEYIIKYYKNDKNNINQLSKSYMKSAVMWLNKAQFDQKFYLSLECTKNDSPYKFIVEAKEKMELAIGDSYTYYVDQESINMLFYIDVPKISPSYSNNNETDFHLSIWAKGYKKLSSDLNGKSSEEKKYNAYIEPVQKDNTYNYTLTIKGTLGDLINVGVLLFDQSNICQTSIEEFEGEEINGIFNSNEMNKVCFRFPEPYINILNKYESLVDIELDQSEYSQSKLICLKKNKYNFYSFHYTKNKNKLNVINSIIGANYELNMKRDESIGLIPMLFDKDSSNYLSYQIKELSGIYESSIITLKNYPFYNSFNEETIKDSFLVTFTSDELKDINSPIGPTQKMLLIICKSEACSINVNLYDKNNKISIYELMPFYNYIRNGTENNFLLHNLNLGSTYYLFFESISGPPEEFSLNFENSKQLENSSIYEIKPDKTDYQLNMKLSSKMDNVYRLAAIKVEKSDNDDFITANIIPDMNYKFKINNGTKYKFVLSNVTYNHIYYLFIRSSDCTIDLSQPTNKEIINIKNQNNSYGYFYKYNTNEKEQPLIVESQSSDCKFDVSFFKYKYSNKELNYIILKKNQIYIFAFSNEDYKQVKYMLTFTKKKLNFNLNVKLINIEKDAKCEIKLYLNDNNFQNETLNKEKNIKIETDNLNKYCKNNYKPCIFTFDLTLDKIKGKEIAEVLINDDIVDYTSDKKKFFLILTVAGGGALFLIIVIIIICACRSKISSDRLTKEVNTISFKEDEDKDYNPRDSKTDDLLY